MKTLTFHPDSDLWRGEQRVFKDIIDRVPDQGIIVEIGTYKGGTAKLAHEWTRERNIRIYTVDIAPQPQAYANLADTSVKMIVASSTEAASKWRQEDRPSIDFLFIDGCHEFLETYQDFKAWAPLLRPGGMVAFHDYDPVERGGLVHMGVQICVDAIKEAGLLQGVKHRYKLLSGTLEPGDLDVQLCRRALGDYARRIVRLRDRDYTGWAVAMDDRFALLLEICLQGKFELLPLEDFQEIEKPLLVSAHPQGWPLLFLKAFGLTGDRVAAIDSVSACCLLDQALTRDFQALCGVTTDLAEFRRWAELLHMLDQGYGHPGFPDEVEHPIQTHSLEQLSRYIARVQFRLNILARLLKTFVAWTP